MIQNKYLKILNKTIFILAFFISLTAFGQVNDAQKEINQVLESWHKAAADADFEAYFSYMTNEGVFLGTDATENWQNKEFRVWSRPYFDAGKAWSFSTVERNIYVDEKANYAWFDELLDTQMELCRGSGVLKLEAGKWKLVHYVLSIAIPNENVSEVTALKAKWDQEFKKKKE